MIFFLALQPGTLLSNVQYYFITVSGGKEHDLADGISQPDPDLPNFLIEATPPADTIEGIGFDSSAPLGEAQKPYNWNQMKYREARLLQLAGKLDLGEPEDSIIPVLAPDAPDQSIGQIVTRNERGVAIPGVKLTFQLQNGRGEDGDSYKNSAFDVASDDDGVLSVALLKGGRYQARRGTNGGWSYFEVAEETDNFLLPEVLGTP